MFSAEALSAVRPLRISLTAAFSEFGVTPAEARIFDVAGVRLHGERDQQTLDGDEAVAGLLGQLLRGGEDLGRGACEIELPGSAAADLRQRRERALDTCQRVRGRPPAAAIRLDAMPSGSSRRTLRMCSGVNCWCPSASAKVCADWMKPRTRSVYFSRFHGCVSPRARSPARSAGRTAQD